jgi:hypothetical protein
VTPHDLWKDTLQTAEREIEEVIRLLISLRIDHQRFIGNLSALVSQGRASLFQQPSETFPTTQTSWHSNARRGS